MVSLSRCRALTVGGGKVFLSSWQAATRSHVLGPSPVCQLMCWLPITGTRAACCTPATSCCWCYAQSNFCTLYQLWNIPDKCISIKAIYTSLWKCQYLLNYCLTREDAPFKYWFYLEQTHFNINYCLSFLSWLWLTVCWCSSSSADLLLQSHAWVCVYILYVHGVDA